MTCIANSHTATFYSNQSQVKQLLLINHQVMEINSKFKIEKTAHIGLLADDACITANYKSSLD